MKRKKRLTVRDYNWITRLAERKDSPRPFIPHNDEVDELPWITEKDLWCKKCHNKKIKVWDINAGECLGADNKRGYFSVRLRISGKCLKCGTPQSWRVGIRMEKKRIKHWHSCCPTCSREWDDKLRKAHIK